MDDMNGEESAGRYGRQSASGSVSMERTILPRVRPDSLSTWSDRRTARDRRQAGTPFRLRLRLGLRRAVGADCAAACRSAGAV